MVAANVESGISANDPWKALKKSGVSALPSGDATREFARMNDSFKNVGLWLVTVGEMENFYKPAGGHGPRWVEAVLDEEDFPTKPQLSQARSFVKEVWDR